MTAMTTVKFEIPEDLAPLIDHFRAEAEGLSDEYPQDVKEFFVGIQAGPIECEARLAERLGVALGQFNLILLFTRGVSIDGVDELIRAIAKAVWNQAYSYEDKKEVVRYAVRADMPIEDVMQTLIDSYGGVEAEIQSLVDEVHTENALADGLE